MQFGCGPMDIVEGKLLLYGKSPTQGNCSQDINTSWDAAKPSKGDLPEMRQRVQHSLQYLKELIEGIPTQPTNTLSL